MFEPQKTLGTPHTLTVALLVIGFIFIPATLAIMPMSVMSFLLTIAGTSACLTLACVNWNRYAKVPVSTLQLARAK